MEQKERGNKTYNDKMAAETSMEKKPQNSRVEG